MALVLPWHLVLILSGTVKGAVSGETGDGDVADGEMGKDGGGGTPELLLSALHLQPLGCPCGQLSIQAGIPSSRGILRDPRAAQLPPSLRCPQSKDLG